MQDGAGGEGRLPWYKRSSRFLPRINGLGRSSAAEPGSAMENSSTQRAVSRRRLQKFAGRSLRILIFAVAIFPFGGLKFSPCNLNGVPTALSADGRSAPYYMREYQPAQERYPQGGRYPSDCDDDGLPSFCVILLIIVIAILIWAAAPCPEISPVRRTRIVTVVDNEFTTLIAANPTFVTALNAARDRIRSAI